MENYDWSSWAACVFSYKFPMAVEMVQTEYNMKQVQKNTMTEWNSLLFIYKKKRTFNTHIMNQIM